MGRKIEQLSIDGVKVDVSKARFADTFEVPDNDESLLAYDEEGVAVVIYRVSTPSFRENKGGEVSRVNVLKVKEFRLAHNEDVAASILKTLAFDQRPSRSLFDTVEEGEKTDVEQVAVSAPVATLPGESEKLPEEESADVIIRADEGVEEYVPEERKPDEPGVDRRVVGRTSGSAADHDETLRRFLESA